MPFPLGGLGRRAQLGLFVQLLDQPDYAIVPVKYLSAVGELRACLLQAPPEAMQEVAAVGAAVSDELQVDVGLRSVVSARSGDLRRARSRSLWAYCDFFNGFESTNCLTAFLGFGAAAFGLVWSAGLDGPQAPDGAGGDGVGRRVEVRVRLLAAQVG